MAEDNPDPVLVFMYFKGEGDGPAMKRFLLILVLVILISLTVVMPALAGGGDDPGKACDHIYKSGWFWGFRQWWNQYQKHGEYKGNFYGPWIPYVMHQCYLP